MRGIVASVVTSLVAISLVTFGTSAFGFTIFGHGASSCGAYIDARHDDSGSASLAFKSWLSGYISAYNEAHGGNILGGTDMPGATRWLDNYCRANPTDGFHSAASALTVFLARKRRSDVSR